MVLLMVLLTPPQAAVGVTSEVWAVDLLRALLLVFCGGGEGWGGVRPSAPHV